MSEQTVPLHSLTPEHDNKSVTIGGAISEVREIITKSGQKMAFVKLEDQTGELEVILFPSAYQQTAGLWERDRVVLIRGKVNARDRDGNKAAEVKVMVDDAREVTPDQATAYQSTGKKLRTPKATASKAKVPHLPGPGAQSATPPAPERLYIRITSSNDEKTLLSLKQTIDENRGSTEVVLVLGEQERKQAIKLPVGFDRESSALEQLEALVGADNLKLQ